MSRINCHSAFKHYEMFHGNAACCGGKSYGSIFNTTYNINCGGHNGGFWGGFGMGLGACFGNLFSGFMGNMGFGGFGGLFGGGMGFGFPSFGGGNWFGGGSSNRVSDSHSSNTTSCNCKGCGNDNGKTNSKNNEDKDQARLKELDDEVRGFENNLKDGINVDQTKLADVRKALELLKNSPIDDINGETNKAHYARLLDDLNEAFPPKNTTTPVAAPTKQAPAVAAAPAQGNEDTVTINGQPVKLSDLTPAQIQALGVDQIKNLTADQAKDLLKTLGLLTQDDSGNPGVKATTNYKALLLTEQSGLPLACGHNVKLDNVQGADAYINGTISDVTLDSTTNIITFVIDDDNAKYKMSCKADSTKYQIAEMVENKTNKYKSAKVGTEYEIKENDNDDYAVRNGEAAIK